jgi:hypothetical protein
MLNNIIPKKDNYKLSTRCYTLNKEKQFKIPSIGLIQSFKIQNYDKLKEKYSILTPVLFLGNFKITPQELYTPENEDVISIKELREHIRNIDFPNDVYENNLLNMEHFLYSQQLKSIEYYYTIQNKDLFDSIFTSGMNVYIELQYGEKDNEMKEQLSIDEITIEETYWDKIREEDTYSLADEIKSETTNKLNQDK